MRVRRRWLASRPSSSRSRALGSDLVTAGVDSESASHTQINQLSGGMKVKVVLAVGFGEPSRSDLGRAIGGGAARGVARRGHVAGSRAKLLGESYKVASLLKK